MSYPQIVYKLECLGDSLGKSIIGPIGHSERYENFRFDGKEPGTAALLTMRNGFLVSITHTGLR